MLEVVIITKNEAQNIEQCILCAKKVSNKILVIDDFSDDDTSKIAQDLGARVIYHKFENFSSQRNFATSNSDAKWILHLDCDEVITNELAKNILEAIKKNEQVVYKIQRVNHAFGYTVSHGVLEKNEVARLFPKDKAKFEGEVHEKLVSSLPIKPLKGCLEHYTYKSWKQWIDKLNLYSQLWAEDAYKKGKRTGFKKAFGHAFGGFFKMAFVKKGIVDGKMSFVLCILHFFYTLMKYLKLIELQNVKVKKEKLKIAILETIIMPAGHESEFDKILVDEIKAAGHEPVFFVPENYPFKMDYNCPVYYLKSEAISYANVGNFKRIFLSIIREFRKPAWLNEALNLAKSGVADAVLVPTCSYRMLKSTRLSKWLNTQIPILMISHGIMPQDRDKFLFWCKKLSKFKNIKIANLSPQEKMNELENISNFFTLTPPVYTPYLLENTAISGTDTLKFGFFGQYRKEKNLEFILESFCKAKFERPVELIVQGSTPTKEDEIDFIRLQNKYQNRENIKFIHKSLIGKEWQEALNSVSVLLVPYGAKRYLYQPSAMLFTAIGFNKPVIASKDLNPEILNEFKIGEFVDLSDSETFAKQLEVFANEFKNNAEIYQNALKNANEKYNGANLANQIVGILNR